MQNGRDSPVSANGYAAPCSARQQRCVIGREACMHVLLLSAPNPAAFEPKQQEHCVHFIFMAAKVDSCEFFLFFFSSHVG
jgi:hypothetical protein